VSFSARCASTLSVEASSIVASHVEHAVDLKPDRQGQEDEGKETSYNISGFNTMVE